MKSMTITYLGENQACRAQDATALIADASTLGELLEAVRRKPDATTYAPVNAYARLNDGDVPVKMGGAPITSPEYLDLVRDHGADKVLCGPASFVIDLETDTLAIVLGGPDGEA